MSIPLLWQLAATLWTTAYPLSESVALLEDIQKQRVSYFFQPTTAYYRPLYHLTLWTLWHGTGSLDATLVAFKIIHITAAMSVVALLLWQLRPRLGTSDDRRASASPWRTAIDAATATIAAAVLIGASGFRDNLEIPLSYTLVGMPLALTVWMFSERERHAWHAPAVVALTLIAIGFKEQGLIIVPLVVAAWWMGAPGITRATAAWVVAIAVAYLAVRLSGSGSWPMFAQAVGYGFGMVSPSEATARFGAFPLWIYGYNVASTIANVLFSEPSAGMFSTVEHITLGQVSASEINQVISSIALTALIGWWGIGCLRHDAHSRWSFESRVFVAVAVTLAASGVLSFNYSRDRLGGIAAVFYALAAFFALRAAADRAIHASQGRRVAIGLLLLLLAGGWYMRANGTIEYARQTAAKNHREWITDLQQRRTAFADRPVYLQIMNAMVDQGVPHTLPGAAATAETLGEAIQHHEVEQAYAFIRAGQDPNQFISFRDPELTGDRIVLMSPLLLAVATHSENVVMMLLSFGADPTARQNHFALCLARQRQDDGIAEILLRDGRVDTKVQCPAVTSQPPLLAFVNDPT